MKAIPTYQKLRGGYYTPPSIARFLARWAIQSPCAEVLEPSCGDGVLLGAAAQTLAELGASPSAIAGLLHGIEIEADEARKAQDRLRALRIPDSPEQVQLGDFFGYCKAHLLELPFLSTGFSARRAFDAIIGNPPFIRYQNFPAEYQQVAFELMRYAGLDPNRLTNAWVPFLVVSTLLLKEHGRLAMVIPAELLQVNYASEVRRFLCAAYGQITLITFRGLVFDDIQQEVVLFLGERSGCGGHGIRTLDVESIEDLLAYDWRCHSEADLKPVSRGDEKWTQYFLRTEEILLLRSLRTNAGLMTLGETLEVDVGIVTGDNDFFVLNRDSVESRSLQLYTAPIVSRSAHLRGAIFTPSDWEDNARKQAPAYLLMIPDGMRDSLPDSLRRYIAEGEARGVDQGFKCRVRKPWYRVRSAWRPDAFMLRQVHSHPKLVLNETCATCTDTVHRVRFRPDMNRRQIITAFVNSLTFAYAELMGRSYGGGVLTFEPSEAEALPLPLSGSEHLDLDLIDRLLRAGSIEAVLDITDQALLTDGLGLDMCQTRLLRDIWHSLRDRRINRNHSKSNGVK